MTPFQQDKPCICRSQNCQIPFGLCHCGCGQKTRLAKQSNTALKRVKGEPLKYCPNHQRTKYKTEEDRINAARILWKIAYRRNKEKISSREKEKYQRDRETILQKRREEKRWLIPEERRGHQDRENERRSVMRSKVLDHYGRKCACCGEAEEMFLEIDHVNSDGAQHRKEIGTASSHIIRWLIKHNFPPGFQLLCSNCNHGKMRCGGICPHTLRDRWADESMLKPFSRVQPLPIAHAWHYLDVEPQIS